MVLGEHDKGAGSSENIQVLKPAKVRISQLTFREHVPPPSYSQSLSPSLLAPPPLPFSSSRQVFTHPSWNPSTINNDISLIKLATPASLGTNVSPVCLAGSSDNYPAGMTCVTSGWGLLRYNGETPISSYS